MYMFMAARSKRVCAPKYLPHNALVLGQIFKIRDDIME